ncbi:hypothetical protein BHE74_00011385 [Ensete ventricosum]|nr:hypothetical protein BHE74_00011385 [Ensete ventricosum]
MEACLDLLEAAGSAFLAADSLATLSADSSALTWLSGLAWLAWSSTYARVGNGRIGGASRDPHVLDSFAHLSPIGPEITPKT